MKELKTISWPELLRRAHESLVNDFREEKEFVEIYPEDGRELLEKLQDQIQEVFERIAELEAGIDVKSKL